jgi:hypothetical protein
VAAEIIAALGIAEFADGGRERTPLFIDDEAVSAVARASSARTSTSAFRVGLIFVIRSSEGLHCFAARDRASGNSAREVDGRPAPQFAFHVLAPP